MYAHSQLRPWQPEAGGEIFSAEPDASGLIIMSATGPNPSDHRTRRGWNPDTTAADMNRRNEFAQGRHAVGLWHTHPEPHPSPSSQDQVTTREYLKSFHGQRSRYFMVIIGNRGTPPVMVVWVLSEHTAGRWEQLREMQAPDVLPLESVIR
ncbi:MAG: Mov34/MPN/PAD-1 family protein [Zoogloea sp.]|nr:Mov34/MPN/PAD-1 family protein [Zoogloea sp.]